MMKKPRLLLLYLCILFILIAVPLIALATDADTGAAEETKAELYTWEYLATYAGATAATLLFVQFTKRLVDKIKKFHTQLYTFMIALIILTLATHFTQGYTLENVLLILPNAALVGMAAYGSYELTFKGADEKRRAKEAEAQA